jgi:glutamyl-tRNA synthetase
MWRSSNPEGESRYSLHSLDIWEDIVNKESASKMVQLFDANVVDLKESDII